MINIIISGGQEIQNGPYNGAEIRARNNKGRSDIDSATIFL